MKLISFLYILLFPILAICQTDSLSFELTVRADSTLDFHTENADFYSYLEGQIDTDIERGFFPREKVFARCVLSENGSVDSVIVYDSSSDQLKSELSNALNAIEKIFLPEQYATGSFDLILIVERWQEVGDFWVKGRIIDRGN